MKKKKKKISKTEKGLRNKLKYQQSLINKKAADIVNLSQFKDDKVKYKGKEMKASTAINYIFEEIVDHNKNISTLANKLERFGYKRRLPEVKEKDIQNENNEPKKLGFAWESKIIEDGIFEDEDVKKVNGYDVKKDMDKILAILLDLRSKMDSEKVMYLLIKPNGNAYLYLSEDEETDQML